MNIEQIYQEINNLPKNPIEWDSAILAKRLKPILLEIVQRISPGGSVPVFFSTTDITNLTQDQLNHINAGDILIKMTDTARHSYRVSYKDDKEGGLCLTYSDCENVETVVYERNNEGQWVYQNTEITHIATP